MTMTASSRNPYSILLLSQLFALSLQNGSCFLQRPTTTGYHSNAVVFRKNAPTLKSSSDGSGMDAMRQMLEASWSVESMGYVPSDPSTAAEAAVTALRQAITDDKMRSSDSQAAKAYFIDLSFPPYDISQGPAMYDEVSAVQFCMGLAQKMSETGGEASAVDSKSLILVRDDETVDIVNRILATRQEKTDEDDSNFVLDKEQIEQLQAEMDDEEEEEEEEDEETDSGEEEPTGGSDVDAFRRKLMADWDTAPTTEATTTPQQSQRPPQPRQRAVSSLDSEPASSTRWSRLASFFGSATISTRTGMAKDVARAIQQNVQLEENENILILLSVQNTREELMALRRIMQLASSTGTKPKTVVLVNCKLEQPLPRELVGAQTVYSLLPLVAKAAESGRTPFQNDPQQQQQAKPVKVAVLRRYPRDWEVFVDDGTGSSFELAASVPVGLETKRGPLMEWVSGAVMRFLQARPR